MTSARNEAEALAIGLELGVIPVTDAVAWADRQIAACDVPPIAVCEIAMAASKPLHDVVHLLRSVPGEVDKSQAIRSTILHLLVALRDLNFDPMSIARSLYDLAQAGDLPDGELEDLAWWCWDEIELSRDGVVEETEGEIRDQMQKTMSDFVCGN